MQLRHRVRDLILASWETDADRVARTLPAGLEPATVDGRHLVTIAALRWDGGRLGYLPVPHFKQVNVRVYARHRDETAVVFLALRVSPLGMGGALLGFPVRPSRARVRDGIVAAKGFGIELRYERRAPAEPGELGSHELGLFEAAGLRELRIRRGEASWERAEAVGPVRADPLLALGFSVTEPPELLYARTYLLRGRAAAAPVRTMKKAARGPPLPSRRAGGSGARARATYSPSPTNPL